VKDLAELLTAIGSFLWPILAFTVFLAHRNEFRTLIRRIRKGKLLGQEIELGDSLDKLENSAKAAIIEVTAVPETRPELPPRSAVEVEREDTSVQKILEEAAKSPKAALLFLASEIERELRRLLASTGWHHGERVVGLKQGFDILSRTEALPPHVASSVRLFSDMRNRLVHGADATDDDVLRAIDSGVTILKALRAIPHEVNIVHHPGVEIYSDPEASQPIKGARGVILETTSPGGASKQLRILPSTRTHFEKGRRVAWEWSDAHSFGPAWYRDPATNEIKQAWHGSMEFTGRHLDEV
jgi:hypothetical protein